MRTRLQPKLTVLLITYNHARFIDDAIEAVLAQETDFRFEILISEDCSTDGTREIVRRFAEENPEQIGLLLSDRNRNDNTVIRRGLEEARGRYVALLDGDDYWTSRHKLQMQVDFLDRRLDCTSCFHNVEVVYDDGAVANHLFHEEQPSQPVSSAKPKPLSTLADVVRGNFIPTCSVVFRAEACLPLPPWYDSLESGDRPLHVLCAEHGYLAYLDEVMGTYRVHKGGVWSRRSKYRHLEDVEATVHVYEVINHHLDFAFDAEIAREVAAVYEAAAYSFQRAGQHSWASVCARRALARLDTLRRAKRWRLMSLAVRGALRRSKQVSPAGR